MAGVTDIKTLATQQGTRLQTLEDAQKSIQEAQRQLIAETEQKFLGWRKQTLKMSPDQRTRRGLGSNELNENFGKAIIAMARKSAPDANVIKVLSDTNLVTVEYATELIRLVEERGVARRLARSVPMGAGTTNWPRRTAGITAAHIAAASAVTESNPTTGQVQLVADTIMGLSLVQNASLEDSAIDLGAYVAEELAYGFATIEDADMVNGDGTATFGGVEGLLNNALYLLTNKPTQVSMAASKTSFADVTFDNLMEMVDEVKSGALAGARWLMHRSVLTILRQIKDDQKRPIWEPATTAGNPATILGYPYEVSDQMPARTDSAAAKRFIVFGNFNYWYLGDRRMFGIVADASRYREYDQTGFFATERIAQNLADGGAFAVLKTAAA